MKYFNVQRNSKTYVIHISLENQFHTFALGSENWIHSEQGKQSLTGFKKKNQKIEARELSSFSLFSISKESTQLICYTLI